MVSRKRRPRNRCFSELTGVLSRNMSKRKIKEHSPKHPLFWMKSKEEKMRGKERKEEAAKRKKKPKKGYAGKESEWGQGRERGWRTEIKGLQ